MRFKEEALDVVDSMLQVEAALTAHLTSMLELKEDLWATIA